MQLFLHSRFRQTVRYFVGVPRVAGRFRVLLSNGRTRRYGQSAVSCDGDPLRTAARAAARLTLSRTPQAIRQGKFDRDGDQVRREGSSRGSMSGFGDQPASSALRSVSEHGGAEHPSITPCLDRNLSMSGLQHALDAVVREADYRADYPKPS